MTFKIIADGDGVEGHRRITLITSESGERALGITGLSHPVPMPSKFSDDDLQRLAQWLVNRAAPMRDTIFELLKELGSTHVN